MKSAFLTRPQKIEIQQTSIPEPGYGELRIKLKQVGVCGSDTHLFLGHRTVSYPLTIGHEGLGFVDLIGPGVQGRAVGERVVIEPNIACGKCRFCTAGRGSICPDKRVIGLNAAGCFAEYVVLPADHCVRLPDNISDNDAVTIEPTAVTVHALFSAKAKPGDTIAVMGLGAIGLLLSHVGLSLGYRVLVSEINPAKIKLAVDMGAIHAPSDQTDILAKIWAENDVAAVFECAGSASTASLCVAAAPRGSEVVVLGLSEQAAQFTPLKTVREGVSIVPSIIYDHPIDFRRTLQLIASKTIRPGFIVSRHLPLDELQTALEWAAEGVETKIVIDI